MKHVIMKISIKHEPHDYETGEHLEIELNRTISHS